MTSIAPILLIVVAIAGFVFGRAAAQGAITAQLSGLMGEQTADILQSAVANSASTPSGGCKGANAPDVRARAIDVAEAYERLGK